MAASAILIPPSWRAVVLEYAAAKPADGVVLAAALARSPRFWRGGWILALQPRAVAMTLGDDVFVSGHLSLATFAHELVHVFQYASAGKAAFLTSYFGRSAATLAYRLVTGGPLNPMRSNRHEEQAYCIAGRFDAWYAASQGVSACSIVV